MTTNMHEVENIKLLDQECSSDCSFAGALHFTTAFQAKYGDKCYAIILEALTLIRKRVVVEGADYLQVFEDGNNERFWLIDDIDHVTALLPSDY